MPAERARRWGLLEVAVYGIAVSVLRVFDVCWFGLRVSGREHLDALRGTGVITVANHVHELDSPMIAAQARGRRVLFTSNPENFRLPLAGWILSHAGVMPVPRGGRELAAFVATLRAELAAGRVVHVFPEGELVRWDRTIRPFRPGAFRFAVELGAPVVPLVFTYGPPQRWRRRPTVRLAVLPPMYPEGRGPRAAAELSARCHAAMTAIARDRRQEGAVFAES